MERAIDTFPRPIISDIHLSATIYPINYSDIYDRSMFMIAADG